MIKQTRITVPVTALALLLAGASAPRALASGFQLREQSASAQGAMNASVTPIIRALHISAPNPWPSVVRIVTNIPVSSVTMLPRL